MEFNILHVLILSIIFYCSKHAKPLGVSSYDFSDLRELVGQVLHNNTFPAPYPRDCRASECGIVADYMIFQNLF